VTTPDIWKQQDSFVADVISRTLKFTSNSSYCYWHGSRSRHEIMAIKTEQNQTELRRRHPVLSTKIWAFFHDSIRNVSNLNVNYLKWMCKLYFYASFSPESNSWTTCASHVVELHHIYLTG
jgi:hypothetical protein